MSESLLGQQTAYPQRYDPNILIAIPRAKQRKKIGLTAGLPFSGRDVWHAYEISWLNDRGLPQVALGRFSVDCTSPALIESKSFKLYLNSHNQQRYASREEFVRLLQQDLSGKAGAEVEVMLSSPDDEQQLFRPSGSKLDTLDIDIDTYQPDSRLLQLESDEQVQESFYTNLFRSNCPITGQPDWATVVISYQGAKISAVSLLAYLVSYRLHNGYHEDCVEQIFCELMRACQPHRLCVQANFLRRGGLDICPIRSNTEAAVNDIQRFARQ